MSYCELCQNYFCNYDLHVNLVHKKKAEYRCRYCGIYFEAPETLFDHIVASHTSGDFKCHFCHKRTKNLDSHLDKHTELYVYSCRCGQKFSSKSTFIEHECHRCVFCSEYVWDFKHYESHICCDSIFVCETFFDEHKVDCDNKFCVSCYEYKSKDHFMFKTCCAETLLCRTQYLSHVASRHEYRCFHCNFVNKNKNSLKLHLRHQTCCGINFGCSNSFEIHRRFHASETNEYCCFHCKLVYKMKKTIRRHLRHRTCCGANFVCLTSFNDHRCLKNSCEWCGKTFKNSWKLREHTNRHKSSNERLTCKFCSKTFTNRRELKYHTARHEGVLNYVCQCGKAFVTNYKLKEHQKTHNKPNFKCNKCLKVFKSTVNFNAHKKTHEMIYSCFHCGQSFARKPTEHIQKVECCQLNFSCYGELMKHEKSVKHDYYCDLCRREYKSRRALLYHKSTYHYDETTLLNGDYSCNVCFRFFSSSHNLMRHKRRSHKKENDFMKDIKQ